MSGFRAEPVVARMDAPATAWKAVGDAVPATSTAVAKAIAIRPGMKTERENGRDALRHTDATSGFEVVNVAQLLPAEASDTTMRAANPNATEADGRALVTQWRVVVTSWQAEGSRVVMTTAEFSNGVPVQAHANQTAPQMRDQVSRDQVSRDQVSPGTPENGVVTEQQVRQRLLPYEVVPVRGGWLVIQL